MPTHICHISQSAGGVETYILNVLRYADPASFRHTVICYTNGTLAENARDAGADVILVPMVRSISPGKDVVSLFRVWSVLREIRPDVIHAHSGKGGVFGRICGTLLRIPVGLTPNAFSHLGQQGVPRAIALAVEKLLSHAPCLLIASSPSEGKRAIEEVGWHPRKVTSRFVNSIDLDESAVHHAPKDTLQVLMIGRLSHQKNPAMFVRVAHIVSRQNPSVRFTILGAGYASDEATQEVTQMIEERGLGDVVQLKAWAGKDVVEAELLQSDIYVSTSRYESFGYTTAEAMAKALPVVATDVDGSVDLIEPGKNGYLVKVDDDETMAFHVSTLAADSAVRERLGRCGRQRVAAVFNIKNNIKVVESIYRSLCESQ